MKGDAVKQAVKSFFGTLKTGSGVRQFNFKSRKLPRQSCYIPKTAIKSAGVYPRVSGKGLVYKEPLPEVALDSRLLWRNGNWYLCVPELTQLTYGENQAKSVVSLDPGIRTFISFYSPDVSGKIGVDTDKSLYKLYLALDNLSSRIASCKNLRRKRSYRKAKFRLVERITNLVTELHYKTANFLCKNFDIIILPDFETSKMAQRGRRKIRSRTVRSMMSLSFYKFRLRLEHVAFRLGKTIVINSEEYTSKTHPETGVIDPKLGSKKLIKLRSGSSADRDIVGAFNLMLKTLVVDAPKRNLASC